MIGFRKNVGLILGFGGVILFGGTLPATRLTVAAIDPMLLTAARACIAGITDLAVLLALRRRIPPPTLWGELFFAGLCTVVGFPMFTALAITSVPAAHGGVVLGIVPLATAAAAAIVAHERPSIGFWIISLMGASIVVAFVLSDRNARTAAPSRKPFCVEFFKPPGGRTCAPVAASSMSVIFVEFAAAAELLDRFHAQPLKPPTSTNP